MITREDNTIKIEEFLMLPIGMLEDRLISIKDNPDSVAKLHIERCVIYRPSRDYPIVAEITRFKPTFINRLKYLITGSRSYLGDVIIIDEIGDKHGDN